jgi:GNAT superfamily N-acetyltransferase
MSIVLRPIEDTDAATLAAMWREHYGAPVVVSRGRLIDPLTLPGYVACDGATVPGVVTYRVDGDSAEVVTLDSLSDGRGIGTALLERVVQEARELGLKRLWLITSNDNISALRFYQKRGWDMVALHRHAIELARNIKPEIPETGNHGIPIRHEIEFEFLLG